MRTQRRVGVTVLVVAALALLLGGAGRARAGLIPLPDTLDQLLPAGNFTVVGPVPYTFSNFTYSTSPVGSPPVTSLITVAEFHSGVENGLTVIGDFFAPAGTVVNYSLSYIVTAPAGVNITDATLSSNEFATFGGTGTAAIGEAIINAATSGPIGTLEIASPPGSPSDTINFAGVNSVLVEADIILFGGSNGASVGIFSQGFSSPASPPPPPPLPSVPEPSTLALMSLGGIALAGWRRWKKRATA